MSFQTPHQSILIQEFLSFFKEKKIHSFLDGTVGAGGHAAVLLEAHPEIEFFFGLDQDPDALILARERLALFGTKVHLIRGNFREMQSLIDLESIEGIFLDLGVSSMQLDRPEKGFSFSKDGPLDMRMDPTADLDAATIINTFSEKDLGTLFREYGEERRWKRAAHAIVEARRKKRIRTTQELCDVLKTVLTWGGRKGKNIHPMTLVFQALRIRVNDELGALQEGLRAAWSLLAMGGRLGVMSFHSLEDRIVKHFFRECVQSGGIILTKKPLVADRPEVRQNPRSRSAKLRFIEKGP